MNELVPHHHFIIAEEEHDYVLVPMLWMIIRNASSMLKRANLVLECSSKLTVTLIPIPTRQLIVDTYESRKFEGASHGTGLKWGGMKHGSACLSG